MAARHCQLGRFLAVARRRAGSGDFNVMNLICQFLCVRRHNDDSALVENCPYVAVSVPAARPEGLKPWWLLPAVTAACSGSINKVLKERQVISIQDNFVREFAVGWHNNCNNTCQFRIQY